MGRGGAKRNGVRAVLAASVALCVTPPSASAQTVAEPFDDAYSVRDIGSPPGVPASLGGLTLKAGTTDRLLIGGAANGASGALYEIGVTRDQQGHITGFVEQDATRYADAAYNDGGVTYGPGGVLFLARWPSNELGQTKPGSTVTDKIVALASSGVASSLSSLGFVPSGLPGAGSLKLASYSGGEWYDADLAADGNGTYDVVNVNRVTGVTLPGGPEGFVFVRAGSAEFSAHSLLVSEYLAGNVAAYALDANGDPVIASRRTFISGLTGAEGAFVDPLTGDFLFSTFGGGSRVIVVSGFAPPTATPTPTPTPTVTPTPTPDPQPETTATPFPQPQPVVQPTPTPVSPPVLNQAVNALPSGTVKVKLPGTGRYVALTAGAQLPNGTDIDARAGRVTIVAARRGGGTEQADFYAGIFRISQAGGLTTLKLTEPLSCPRSNRARAAAKKKSRKLWGSGSGRFRTAGQFSSATVRGTRWLTQDRCESTTTRVVTGVVAVRDNIKRKTVIVRARRSYTARRR
jgi:hypothetical protein